MASAARPLAQQARLLTRRNPIASSMRCFSASPLNRAQEDRVVPPPPKDRNASDYPAAPEYSPENLDKETRSMYDLLSPQDRSAFDQENQDKVARWNDPVERAAMFREIDQSVQQIDKETDLRFEEVKSRQLGFWAEDEPDEFGQVEDGDEEINDDEMTSMAHAEVELHREMREYARITAWDMPMLSKLAQPFTLPPQTHILRFRYTSFMGEEHPGECKVVVELASQDLVPKYLTEAQRQTFLKLAGVRYNPQTDIVRMSCAKFPESAQNKRYLGDIVNSLIKEAKEGDSFADIPLDLRHHKPKHRIQFPEEWKMTEARRSQLAARRQERLSAESTRAALVNGSAILTNAIKVLPSLNPSLQAKAEEERERVAVKTGARKKIGRR
ncbi:hypothetical protein N7452_003006 [Penicillium brevicompactum]|uniref:Small ribosomal subunit protein mS35 mitochondrial conserved domain-containing protein n=1 Tax=Penicillium brevicompactum TaxID=5074 RepID=A0A9W9QSZ6_PENBR|nr:hypothetical protein N7452_003006 [Penicillium brevicompactum]